MNKLIVAHRGASKLARENTLQSFQKAIDLGADMVELDVWKTADGQLVVFHDNDLEGAVISSTSLSTLNTLAAKHNFQIPTLKQVLEAIKGKVKASIEIKAEGYEQECLETIERYLEYNDFEIISFKFSVLKTIRNLKPQVKLALILGWGLGRPKRFGQMLYFFLHLRKILNTVNAFCFNWRLLNIGLQRLIPSRYPLTVWTVDEPGLIKKFLKHPRVSCLTSNDCELALNIRSQMS